MKKTTRETGTSLIDMSITAAVIATALIGTLMALLSSTKVGKTSGELERAKVSATSLLEEVRGSAFDSVVADFDGTTRQMTTPGHTGSVGTLTVSVVRVDDASTRWAIYEATVRADWKSENGSQAFEVSTFVGDRYRGTGLAGSTVVTPGGN